MAVDGWVETTLGELCKMSGGSGFSPKYQGHKDLPIPFIKVSDMNLEGNEVYVHRAINTVDETLLKKIKAKKFPVNTLILPKVGAALLTNKRRLLAKPSAVDNNVMALLPEKIDYQYLYQWSLTLDLAEYVQSGAVPSVNQSTLESVEMSVPSLPEQKKIAGILGSVDEAIAKTQGVIAQTQRVKQGLLQTLLTQGINHTKFKQTELGEIPESWEVVSLDEICTVIRGASPRPKGDPRFYGGSVPRLMVADITRDGKYITAKIDFLTEEGALKSRPMPKGALVMVCSGTIVGVPGILAKDACIHDGILGFKDIEKCEVEYLFYVFKKLQQNLQRLASHAVYINLNTQTLKDFKVALPSLEEQKAISSSVAELDDLVSSQEKKLSTLITLKKGLMADLLSGRVRVDVGLDTKEEAA